MGLWLSTRAKSLALPGNNKPGHGAYDMLPDKLATEGKGPSAVAIDTDGATSQHLNSEIGGMASHLKERIKLLYALRDFHNARVMSETDVADALTELSGTVGGLHDENKIVQNLLGNLSQEMRRQADQHSHIAKKWGEGAIKALDSQIKQSEEFLGREQLYPTLRNCHPHSGGSVMFEGKEGGSHEQNLDMIRGSYKKLEDSQLKFFEDYLWEYCDSVAVPSVYDDDNASIGQVLNKSIATAAAAPLQDAIPGSEVGPEIIVRVPAQDPDDTGLPDSPLPSYQDEGSLGEQTRILPVVSTDHDSDGVLFYVKALYDYTATVPEEFNFVAGDIIAVAEVERTGWWTGHRLGSKAVDRQIFPSNYTVVIQL